MVDPIFEDPRHLQVDMAVMTGNVAQVFLGDDEWASVLRAARAALRPGGVLVFEVRDPAREGWREWHRALSHGRIEVPGVGVVESWVDLTEVAPPVVSFRWTFVFEADGTTLTSDSTLRFRSRDEVVGSLAAADLVVREIRDAPDRPGRELVFLATRPDARDDRLHGDGDRHGGRETGETMSSRCSDSDSEGEG